MKEPAGHSVGRPTCRWTDDILKLVRSRWMEEAHNCSLWHSMGDYVKQLISTGDDDDDNDDELKTYVFARS